jgi:hypothetical protein
LPSYDFTGLEIINNSLFLATANEVISINCIENINVKAPKIPEPYFTSIVIDDQKQPLINNEILLSHNTRKLEISFNTTGFLSKENIRYKYRLLDDSQKTEKIPWDTEETRSNKVIYNKLPEGNYSFQLVATSNGVSSMRQQIAIEVTGVFYKQWWFYLLLSIGVVISIWGYFYVKNKRVNEKQKLIFDKQQQELENVFLKLESLRSQMNPHFIFNALNSIQDYILHNEKKLARTYLVKFSRLIRIYLEHSQKNTITVSEEIEALTFYLQLEKDRFEDTFDYLISVSNDAHITTILIPTFLIQPYVENAIKHGLLHKKDNRKLLVEFSVDEENSLIKCIIEDNGIGRKYANEIKKRTQFSPKSFSSEANLKRIELLNKTRENPIKFHIDDKVDKNKKAQGTRVTISIPFSKNTFY